LVCIIAALGLRLDISISTGLVEIGVLLASIIIINVLPIAFKVEFEIRFGFNKSLVHAALQLVDKVICYYLFTLSLLQILFGCMSDPLGLMNHLLLFFEQLPRRFEALFVPLVRRSHFSLL